MKHFERLRALRATWLAPASTITSSGAQTLSLTKAPALVRGFSCLNDESITCFADVRSRDPDGHSIRHIRVRDLGVEARSQMLGLTSGSKQNIFGSARSRFFSPQGSICPMRCKDCREVHARVEERVIFATRNSLKSQVTRNLKSPIAILVPSSRSCTGV
jgi:hypothetical protein